MFSRLVDNLTRVILAVILLHSIHAARHRECTFPDFVRSMRERPSEDGPRGDPGVEVSERDLKPWSTHTYWRSIRKTPLEAERQAVYVTRRLMWSYRQTAPRACDPFDFQNKPHSEDCPQPRLLYNRTCLVKESETMFRVMQTAPNRKPRFLCLEFIQRGSNIVQVREGSEREKNDPDLCDNMVLNEWPWIAPWQKEHTRCPVSGGFTFRSISGLTNDDICPREWRRTHLDAECIIGDGMDFFTNAHPYTNPYHTFITPSTKPPSYPPVHNDICPREWRRSHLDAECIIGDGMDFFAPKGSRCNPFSKMSDWSRLGCWSSWEQDGYIYIIAGSMREHPKFCLRFPKDRRGEFTIHVYFSVICPSDSHGTPPRGIEYYELRARHIDPKRCDDEGRRCKDVARRGACNRDVNKYAKHCRKSCSLCPHAQKRKQTCVFPARFYGDWQLYTGGHTERVNINGTHVTLSNLGKFACAEPHPTDDLYKLHSIFFNGCSDRYTCIEMKRYNQNLLQYKVGRSMRMDKAMSEMCVFSDDPAPLFKSIRSFSFKNLLEKNRIIPTLCGLDGTYPFNTTVNGQPCSGYISDWNDSLCAKDTRLRVWSHDCPHMEMSLEFECLASIRDAEGVMDTLIITRTAAGLEPQFNCWVLTLFKGTGGTSWPWRILYRLNTTQCDYLTDIEVLVTIQPLETFYLHDDRKSKTCRGKNHHYNHALPWKPTRSPTSSTVHRTKSGGYVLKSSRTPYLTQNVQSSLQNDRPKGGPSSRSAFVRSSLLLVVIVTITSVCSIKSAL